MCLLDCGCGRVSYGLEEVKCLNDIDAPPGLSPMKLLYTVTFLSLAFISILLAWKWIKSARASYDKLFYLACDKELWVREDDACVD